MRQTKERWNQVRKPSFDVQAFLDSAGIARRVIDYQAHAIIFSQGDPAVSVMYIQQGAVQLSVLSETGKQAIVATLGTGDFFGEGALAGQALRMGTASALEVSTILVTEKEEMIRMLHEEHDFSDRFIAHMLARNVRIEADLVDQLFNSSEKRLARTLLLMARYGKQNEEPRRVRLAVSQEALAETIGTTRSRVNFFMNKFRKLGFIDYDGSDLTINPSLLSVVLHD